ncbi:hypothetical protein VHUM_04200 [Vanrija humicola]|uniref:Tethering factor for nuclear proteasome STS1 n=1 Tax=Vanrija humicola TaxID=5417 RepID=A0A7D8UYV0_VANHU|nr:hypothetical protein VHUM_04200 [Vanrija humicola]
MAHPLTQHPPNMIGFGAPATMSPLGFGFGQPAHLVAARSPGFGLNGSVSAPPSPSPHSPHHHHHNHLHSTAQKRTRRTSSLSPSPSSSPSPDDDEIEERSERRMAKVKRVRKEAQESVQEDKPDVGLLLASMPPTSHLPILLELLQENPALAPRVLRSMPTPPLSNVLETLERIVSKIGKAAGSWEPQSGYVATRRWNRAGEHVQAWTKSASTYLKFFTTSNSTSTPTEPQTIYHLLHALTTTIVQILAIVPAGPPPNAKEFLDLANSVLSAWSDWVSALSDEVNQRGGMFPQSTVQNWADGIAALAAETLSVTAAAAPVFSSWSTPMPLPSAPAEPNPYIEGFKIALQPLRERFVNELGWLVAR